MVMPFPHVSGCETGLMCLIASWIAVGCMSHKVHHWQCSESLKLAAGAHEGNAAADPSDDHAASTAAAADNVSESGGVGVEANKSSTASVSSSRRSRYRNLVELERAGAMLLNSDAHMFDTLSKIVIAAKVRPSLVGSRAAYKSEAEFQQISGIKKTRLITDSKYDTQVGMGSIQFTATPI